MNRNYNTVVVTLEVSQGQSRSRKENKKSANDLKRVQRLFLLLCADFKRGAKLRVRELMNVNAYQLMCHVMQLEAQPQTARG